MRVIHEIGKYLAVEECGIERFRYQYQLPEDSEPSAPKPFIHPMRTPDGIEITADAPLDHFWHRGIWFTWKYINGVNYWEENQDIVGRQVTLAPPQVESVPEDHSAIRWLSELEWRDTKDGAEQARLYEQRIITCRLYPDGALTIDWHISQTALEPLTLDRTIFTTWGGYGGLVVRMTQALQKQTIVFDDGTESNHPIGEPYRWGGIQGQLDTGKNRYAAFVFMPSPRNRRSPEPFYGDAKPFYNFFGPAPLFHEPLTLQEEETLNHAVRVLVLPRSIAAEEVSMYYNDWLEREGVR